MIFKNQARGTDDKGKKKEFINVNSPFGTPHMTGMLIRLFRTSFDPIFTSDS